MIGVSWLSRWTPHYEIRSEDIAIDAPRPNNTETRHRADAEVGPGDCIQSSAVGVADGSPTEFVTFDGVDVGASEGIFVGLLDSDGSEIFVGLLDSDGAKIFVGLLDSARIVYSDDDFMSLASRACV